MMNKLTRVCVLIMALGLMFGGFFFGGGSGSALGLVMAMCIAVPLYCLVSTFTRQAASAAESSFQNTPSSVNLDSSRLPLAAYDQIGLAAFRKSLDRVEKPFPGDLGS